MKSSRHATRADVTARAPVYDLTPSSQRKARARRAEHYAQRQVARKNENGILRSLRRATARLLVMVMIGAGGYLMLDGLLPRPSLVGGESAAATPAPAVAPVWTIDLDGDGVADLANPTHGGVRGVDAYGGGQFGAGRDKGHRKHAGTDFVAAPGSTVWAPLSGIVTYIGYAYHDDESLRFIEIKDATRHLSARLFYVDPTVKVGETVVAGGALGSAETLGVRYPLGITNHVHVELRDARGVTLDPSKFLPPSSTPEMLAMLTPPTRAVAPS